MMCWKQCVPGCLLFVALLGGGVMADDTPGTWKNKNTQEKNTQEKKFQLPPAKLSLKMQELLTAEDWQGAIQEMNEAYKSTIGDPNLRFYIAACYLKLAENSFRAEQYRDTAILVENALHYVKDDPTIHMLLGNCYFQLSEYEQAEAAYLEVLRLDPPNYHAHRQLGEIYYLTSEYERAVTFWKKALEIKKDDPFVTNRLQALRKQLKADQGRDAEMDSVFTVTFDGEKNPKLRETVVVFLEEMYRDIGSQLNMYPRRRITITLLTKKEFVDITRSPKWAGGAYEGQIKIPVENYDPAVLKIVLRHEYVHALIYDIMANRCPWWLNEGIAQYFSGDDAGNAMKKEVFKKSLTAEIKTKSILNGIPTKDMASNSDAALFAYAAALSAVEYLIQYFGVPQLQSILETMGDGKSFDAALLEITGFSFTEFESNWVNEPG